MAGMAAAAAAAAAPHSCASENGCVMFNCLVHLWEWIDPPLSESEFPMEGKNAAGGGQPGLTAGGGGVVYSTQPAAAQPPAAPLMQQLLHSHYQEYQAGASARSPLLEHRHDLYGTGATPPHEYARHYPQAHSAADYSYPPSPPQETHTNLNHDLQNVPKGYNAEVYQDYLKRNPPKDTNQIYQNHQPLYREQYSSKPYLPYSNRIGPQSNTELLKRQYNEIQQMKLQQQMHYQNQAQMQQQQKFAERQILLQQLHGVQPPPNLQNSLYGELERYSSKPDFYTNTDIQKDVDRYAKNNDYKEMDKQSKQFQEPQWQSSQQTDFREADRYRKEGERGQPASQSPPVELNNQKVGVVSPLRSSDSSPSARSPLRSGAALRSPVLQRQPSAPVTMAGLLHKQGSDGLKVWRKRWFVLSEYCLFYYKSQDEEKLLGSVLLPSYRVSACTAEDKVLRKHAFKLEHANMRTYVLAAPDHDTMVQWVKALTMAALMQTHNESPQKYGEQQGAAKPEVEEEVRGPTYANAPPKPRRSNEGYNSPSPEMYDPNYDLLKKPASQYSQGTQPRYDPTDYGESRQYGSIQNHDPQYVRSPHHPHKRPYDTQHLSLPLTNTVPDRLNQPSTSTQRPNQYFDRRSQPQPPQEQYDRSLNPFLQDNTPDTDTPTDTDIHIPVELQENREAYNYPDTTNAKLPLDQPMNSETYDYQDTRNVKLPLDQPMNREGYDYRDTRDVKLPVDQSMNREAFDYHGTRNAKLPADLSMNREAYDYQDTRNAKLPADQPMNREAYDYRDTRDAKLPLDQSMNREAYDYHGTRNAKLPADQSMNREAYDYQDTRNAKLPADQPMNREAYDYRDTRDAKLPLDQPMNREAYDYHGTRNAKLPADQSMNREAYDYQDTRNAKLPLDQPINREAYDYHGTRNTKLPADQSMNREAYDYQDTRNAKLPLDQSMNREAYDYQDTRNAKLPLDQPEAYDYHGTRNAKLPLDQPMNRESYDYKETRKLPEQPYKREVYGDLNMRQRSTSSMNERMIERRTPDAYGRAAAMMAYRNKAGDYEDVYSSYTTDNDYGSTYPKASNPFQAETNQQRVQDYTPTQYPEKTFSGPSVLRRKKMAASGVQNTVPRPHSADFLEYEARQQLTKTLPEPPRQPQRPKSSLDINSFYDPSSDRYYSEESYAQKMRQSAQYLNPVIGPRNIQIPLAKYASGLAEKQLNSPYSQTTNNNYEMGFGPKRTLDNNSNATYGDVDGLTAALNCNWTLKEKALENQKHLQSRGSVAMMGDGNRSSMKDPRSDPAADTFLRSASARLPSNTTEKGEKKVQQREESMKRLLEWKQRMLQSPLTRKSTPATISLARSLNHSRQSLRSDQYRPKTYGNYNSYSSDDEEETTGTDLPKPREKQAGRSQTLSVTGANITPPLTSHSPPTPLVAHPHDAQTTDNTYENILCTNNIYVEQTSDPKELCHKEEDGNSTEDDQDGCETQDSEAESEGQMEYTDNDLDEVLLESDTEAQHAEATAEPQADNKQDTKIDQSGDKLETPPACSPGEDHYMPMSPRKTSTIEPAHKTILQNLSVFNQSAPHGYEDNPYVEMNVGNEEEDMQTYEVVCVNNGKVEPVYMELSNFAAAKQIDPEDSSTSSSSKFLLDTASNFADTKDLTLKRASKADKTTKEKSDCSDADDEASKEISLDAPFSRFSISDNFRPASYYLGASLKSSETIDSLDSDTLSTVLKPSFTLPCEELSGEALSKYILDKIDSSDMSQDNSILKMLTSENQKMNTVKRKATSLMIYGSRTSIHDTLSRGEKIRSSRASLTNDKKMSESPVSLVSHSILEHYNSSSVESDSLRSYNADRGSSRLSLESDISSKFEMAPSNISSEVTSLNESDLVDFRYPKSYEDLDIMIKRRPVSDDSIFELSASSFPVEEGRVDTSNLATNFELDKFLDNLQPGTSTGHLHEDTSILSCSAAGSSYKDNMVQAAHFRGVSHTRCSSTPASQSTTKGSNYDSCARKIDAPISGYVGSHSSCSSGGLAKSPISYYCKGYDEEKISSKNLNNDVLADKIKEFDCEKITLKSEIETNTSSTTTGFHSRESSTEHSAPYYYSDLSSQEHINLMPTSHYLKNTNLHRKLNNQRRRGPFHKKTDISHIHNPIRNSDMLLADTSFDLANSARSVSVEFLSAADKDPEIDMKNIYASSGVRNSKIPESMSLISGLGCKRNSSNFESSSPDSNATHRSSPNTSSAIKISNASMSSHCSGNSSNTVYYDAEAEASETRAYENIICQGEKHWDEDSLWRDNLRRVSHRHARSMDDLDTVPLETPLSPRNGADTCGMNSIKRVKKQIIPNKITRNVTYVNCDIQNEVLRRIENNTSVQNSLEDNRDDNDVYVSLAENVGMSLEHSDEGVYEQLAVSSDNSLTMQSVETIDRTKHMQTRNRRKFEIDREKLRQWDLMSSGLMKRGGGVRRVGAGGAAGCATGGSGAGKPTAEASMTLAGTNVDLGTNSIVNQQPLSKPAFVGSNASIGRAARDVNIPVRAVSPRVRWVQDKAPHPYSQLITTSQQNLNLVNDTEDAWSSVRSPSRTQQPIRAVSPRIRRNTENDEMRGDGVPTAGELLGRTHEELVLLLIQLRRRHAATRSAIEHCNKQIQSLEDCLSSLKAMDREESIQRLEQLKSQLTDLEGQYEKSKPLVHLVDNMVKLGSLYNRPGSTVERLERNQRLRQKVLAEHAVEQQRWLESAAAGQPLETEAARARVAELWALEQELADEASILQGLRTDKDALECLLTGVGDKLRPEVAASPLPQPPAAPAAPAPLGTLEAELARVHAMLAHNSKKLEQTVADNARLERELQALRRALHARRASTRQSHAAHPTALLEDEVSRVQQLVSQLQRQRQELSRAVRHLTQQSHALQLTHDSMPGKHHPTSSSWQETNLDTGHTTDHCYQHYDSAIYPPTNVDTPLYVDTRGADVSPLNSEDLQSSAFSNLSNVEKQEIKTVRIVKRESERRQRDRERSLQPLTDWPHTEYLDDSPTRGAILPRPDYSRLNLNLQHNKANTRFEDSLSYYSKPQEKEANISRFEAYYCKPQEIEKSNMELSPKFPSSPSLSNCDYSRGISSLSSSYNKSYQEPRSASSQYLHSPSDSAKTLTNDQSASKASSITSLSLTRSTMELSPIFKSEAAKQIITEMKPGSLHRRQVPKEKRRHYTAPHHLSAKVLNEMPKDGYNQDKMGRSVDDVDMERALRSAPDVVSSALPIPTRYADSIDQLLAAPQKILIPERYIPEKPPELSPEEQQKRQEKVESIKKMLSGTPADSSTKSPDGEEKRQREHLLQMNQLLAKQVTEMSKIIAVKALGELPSQNGHADLDDRSPDVELPIYQQRDNFFT